jgi:four helix bundle protein
MSGVVRSVQDLIVWQRGIDLVEQVYVVSSHWPTSELYGLTNQARRAAISIPANIAEGQGRGSAKDFARFLSISRGSLRELETHLIIALRLQFFAQSEFDCIQSIIDEVGRLLQGLSRRLTAA